jgi:hypothetical protein
MSDCTVCIGGGSDDVMDFAQQTFPKAYKPHRCCECGRLIQTGTKHEKYTGKYDGGWDTYRTCMDCVYIRDGLRCGQSWMFGGLWEDIDQIWPEITTACLNRIETASAKAYLVERWRIWKGLAGSATPPPSVLSEPDTGAPKTK